MSDVGAKARIANASVRKSLASLLGESSPSANSNPSDRSPQCDPSDGVPCSADLYRQEQLEMHSGWQEASKESAGVGSIPLTQSLPQNSKTSHLLTLGSEDSIEDKILRRRMLGSSINVKSKVRSEALDAVKVTALGKRNRNTMTSRVQRDGAESEDEDGRSALGKSRSDSRGLMRTTAVKRATEVETFESMQRSSQQAEPGSEAVEGDVEAEEESSRPVESMRPQIRSKYYLDEILEARKNKRKKKNKKASEKGSHVG